MFAKEFNTEDFERLVRIVDSLIQSEKLTEEEKWAVDQSCGAASDLLAIRHSEILRKDARCIL